MNKTESLSLNQQLESIGQILVGLAQKPKALENLRKAVKSQNARLYSETVRNLLPEGLPLPDCITFTRTLQAVLTDASHPIKVCVLVDKSKATLQAVKGAVRAAKNKGDINEILERLGLVKCHFEPSQTLITID